MSIRPSDSVYGVPQRPDAFLDALPSSHERPVAPGAQPKSGDDVEWANAELVSIASTIQELQGRLELANSKLESASNVETTEFEIGRLFVEAQRFSEESLSKLELQIHHILDDAEAKAAQILMEATQEAHQIRQEAQHAAIAATKAARELRTAISGFTDVNNELVKELGTLNAMLLPSAESGVADLGEPPEALEGR